jgi:hypothetical protein
MSKLKLEPGRYYRTRDGRKVGPMREDTNPMYFCTTVEGRSRSYRPDGTRQPESGYPELTIVAEWADEPTTHPYEDLCAKPETELERLVRVANVGLDAMRTLYQTTLGNQVRLGASEWMSDFHAVSFQDFFGSGGGDKCQATLSIKRRPAFEPFYVGPAVKPTSAGDAPPQAWRVSLSDDGKTLSVGCQTFDAKDAEAALRWLCVAKNSGTQLGGRQLNAVRDGLQYTGLGRVSYEDADRILAALEKALGKEAA